MDVKIPKFKTFVLCFLAASDTIAETSLMPVMPTIVRRRPLLSPSSFAVRRVKRRDCRPNRRYECV